MNARCRVLLACTVAALCVSACARPVDGDEARKQIQQLLDTYVVPDARSLGDRSGGAPSLGLRGLWHGLVRPFML